MVNGYQSPVLNHKKVDLFERKNHWPPTGWAPVISWFINHEINPSNYSCIYHNHSFQPLFCSAFRFTRARLGANTKLQNVAIIGHWVTSAATNREIVMFLSTWMYGYVICVSVIMYIYIYIISYHIYIYIHTRDAYTENEQACMYRHILYNDSMYNVNFHIHMHVD